MIICDKCKAEVGNSRHEEELEKTVKVGRRKLSVYVSVGAVSNSRSRRRRGRTVYHPQFCKKCLKKIVSDAFAPKMIVVNPRPRRKK